MKKVYQHPTIKVCEIRFMPIFAGSSFTYSPDNAGEQTGGSLGAKSSWDLENGIDW